MGEGASETEAFQDFPAKKRAALKTLAAGGLYAEAAEAARVTTRTLRNWRKRDEAFAEAWAEAWDAGTDTLEDVLQTCAQKAVEDKGYQTSLLFSLKCRRPHKWQDRVDIRHSGTVEHSIEADQALAQLERLASRLPGPAIEQQAVPALPGAEIVDVEHEPVTVRRRGL